MEWIKIKEDGSNLPPFDKLVLLMKKSYSEPFSHQCDVGMLSSISSSGPNFKLGTSSLFDGIENLFGGNPIKREFDKFRPTHYCFITIPED